MSSRTGEPETGGRVSRLGGEGPLTRGSWWRMVEGCNLASLLVVIESRLGSTLRARCEPEDVLQESLLLAWRDREHGSFASLRAFRSWLLTVIDHRIRDLASGTNALKRGGGRPMLSLGEAGAIWPEPARSTTPSRVAIVREQAASMREALALVPEEAREVVRLRLFHQFTLDEIAAQLGLGLGTVRGHLRRGAEIYRRRLREAVVSRGFLSVPSAEPPADAAS